MCPPSPPLSEPARPEDTRWFVEQVHSHDAALKGYLRQSFPALRDVDDIAQESYVRIWRQRSADSIRSARALLFRIAQHVALDLMRRHRRSPVQATAALQEIAVADTAPGAPELLGRREKVELLTAAIDRLPARCREVVILRKLHLLPTRTTAQRLGITEKCVENHLARGLERCRAYLQARGVEDLFRHDR